MPIVADPTPGDPGAGEFSSWDPHAWTERG
eukprot:gene10638-biopygen5239